MRTLAMALPRRLGALLSARAGEPALDRLPRQVALAGGGTALIFLAVDYSSVWSGPLAAAGMVLIGALLIRQLGWIQALEQQVTSRSAQLSTVSGVVSSLNSSLNVGGNLGDALDKLLSVLEADAGAIWLPSAGEEGQLALVEHRGLPDPERQAELLGTVRAALPDDVTAPVYFTAVVPGAADDRPAAQYLTVKLGRRAEDFGYLTVMKWTGSFSDTEGSVLDAIGSDIGGALRSVRMISEARKLADRDPVTLVYNHRSGYQRLAAEVEKHARKSDPMALLMLDLDNFKLFNDTYGHPAGDEVLKRVAAVLRRCCREDDVLARYGGDEFLLVLPNTSLQQAVKCAERIRTILSKERFRCENSASLPIALSCGVGVYPADGTDVLELISAAETNLIHAKASGDGQISARSEGAVARNHYNFKGVELFFAMLTAVDNKDRYTRKHSEDVTEYSLQIARALDLDAEMLDTIQTAGILHDVGKIGVPDSMLKKPGHLTDEEFVLMKQHPVLGAHIVGAMPGMEKVVLGVRHHHERYDGRGYPDRLAGLEIPLIGRIMAVADAFSAMTTTRPYRKGLTERQALLEIERNLGSQFDPEIGAMFVKLRRELGEATTENAVSPAPRRPWARKCSPPQVLAGAPEA